jgi:hypothetical protein
VNDPVVLRNFVALVLRNPQSFNWTVQGLGQMRLYLNDELRLHVWDPTRATPGSSTKHSHPWDFDGSIIVGKIVNFRYTLTHPNDPAGLLHQYQTIMCGTGVDPAFGDPRDVWLKKGPPELLFEGASYSQRHDEIHESCPTPGYR